MHTILKVLFLVTCTLPWSKAVNCGPVEGCYCPNEKKLECAGDTPIDINLMKSAISPIDVEYIDLRGRLFSGTLIQQIDTEYPALQRIDVREIRCTRSIKRTLLMSWRFHILQDCYIPPLPAAEPPQIEKPPPVDDEVKEPLARHPIDKKEPPTAVPVKSDETEAPLIKASATPLVEAEKKQPPEPPESLDKVEGVNQPKAVEDSGHPVKLPPGLPRPKSHNATMTLEKIAGSEPVPEPPLAHVPVTSTELSKLKDRNVQDEIYINSLEEPTQDQNISLLLDMISNNLKLNFEEEFDLASIPGWVKKTSKFIGPQLTTILVCSVMLTFACVGFALFKMSKNGWKGCKLCLHHSFTIKGQPACFRAEFEMGEQQQNVKEVQQNASVCQTPFKRDLPMCKLNSGAGMSSPNQSLSSSAPSLNPCAPALNLCDETPRRVSMRPKQAPDKYDPSASDTSKKSKKKSGKSSGGKD